MAEHSSEQHVPFMIISPSFVSHRLRHLQTVGKVLVRYFPSLDKQLKCADISCSARTYLISALCTTILLGILFSGLFYAVAVQSSKENPLLVGILAGLGLSLLLFLVFTCYPSIIAKKVAGDIDKHLIFALKDLLMHTASGASLFNALLSVSEAGYGTISKEFLKTAKEIHTGTPIDVALENMAKRTESEYLNKVIWQIVNTLRAGGNLKQALQNIVGDLAATQRSNIINYANELNLWSLVYMLFAVAIPTIGMTMMIILSSFADVGLSETSLIFFISFTFAVQLIIIGFIKTRRPLVEF